MNLMAKQLLYGFLGVLVGLVVFILGFVITEAFSYVVHPFPADFNHTQAELCAHVAKYPHWVLGVVVGTWGVTAFLASATATRVGGWIAGLLVSLIVGFLCICNVLTFPYPKWFVVAECISIPFALLLGLMLISRRKASTSVAKPT